MKKIKYCLVLTLVTVLFTSCFEDKDNWYTNTKEYDGRYSVAMTCEEEPSYDKTIRDGHELLISNSAANVKNQIIIDSRIAIDAKGGTSFHIKGKFDIEGDISSFKTTIVTPNIASKTKVDNSEFYLVNEQGEAIAYPSSLGTPTKAGEEHKGAQLYTRLSIAEGKIIPKGATTIGGNVSDSVYIEITTYSDYLIIESYQIPEKDWKVPGVAEFAWQVKEGSRTNAAGWEEHWKFNGYRYTGYPEDNPSTQPPITEK